MKIATFNINGIKARMNALSDWLDEANPDVAILQEIKSQDEGFPREAFEDKGYNVETHGQKGFNGVAILSKLPLEDVTRGLPGAQGAGRARRRGPDQAGPDRSRSRPRRGGTSGRGLHEADPATGTDRP